MTNETQDRIFAPGDQISFCVGEGGDWGTYRVLRAFSLAEVVAQHRRERTRAHEKPSFYSLVDCLVAEGYVADIAVETIVFENAFAFDETAFPVPDERPEVALESLAVGMGVRVADPLPDAFGTGPMHHKLAGLEAVVEAIGEPVPGTREHRVRLRFTERDLPAFLHGRPFEIAFRARDLIPL